MEKTINLIHFLEQRQLGKEISSKNCLNLQIQSTINGKFRNLSKAIETLRTAMNRKDWNQISTAVGGLVTILLDGIQSESLTKVSPEKREEREMFVLLGGMSLFVQFLGGPLSQSDARNMNSNHVQRYAILWNEILVLLREVCFSLPNLSNQIFRDSEIAFLFTLLSHDLLFDNTMNLLEEILAIRVETFCLSQIQNLYQLIDKFTTRRLAHFCRVLALILFEPEDRIIMENAQILRSYELLSLRKERMNKLSPVDIEKNQCLIIEMPGLLKKLVTLLKLSNYGPTISELLQNNFAMPNDLTTEFIMHLSPARSRNEWSYLETLEKIIEQSVQGRRSQALSRSQRTSLDSWLTEGFDPADEWSLFGPGDIDEAFPPSPPSAYLNSFSTNQTHQMRNMEHTLLDLMRVMRAGNHTPQQAMNELQFQALALAPHQVELLFVLCTLLSGRRKVHVQIRFAELGLANILLRMFDRLTWDTRPEDLVNTSEHIHGPNCECNPVSALRVQYLRLVHNFFDRDFHNNLNKTHMLSPGENKILSKYQKQIIYKQQLLQSLMNSPNNDEIRLLLEGIIILDPEDRLIGLPADQIGILRNIMRVLKLEKPDSIYRFWLTSCLEAYLRGLGNTEQVFISSFDMLPHLIKHICFDYPSSPSSSNVPSILSTSTLQSSFDFLGEIIRFNFPIIEKVENILLHDRLMDEFFSTLSHHLIDSNVFLRALFITFDLYHEKYQDYIKIKTNLSNEPDSIDVDFKFMPNHYCYLPPSCLPRNALYESLSTGITPSRTPPLNDDRKTDSSTFSENPTAVVGYLSHSWIHFQPQILSAEAESQLQQHEELQIQQYQSEKKPFSNKSKKFIRQQKKSPLTAKSSLRSQPTLGSLHDALTSIKNATSHFLTSPSRKIVDLEENFARSIEVEPLDENRLGEIIALETKRESRLKACMDVIPAPFVAQPIHDQIETVNVESYPSSEDVFQWILPSTVKYLSSYLEHQKEHILYELMTIVTLRSINHENICCINTSILIFISAHKRGQVPKLITGLKYLSKSKQSKSNIALSSIQEHYVLINFREMLWYWIEYYTRRGRDRLSLEFSTHIPFYKWKEIVDLMCKDDGSPCSLLSSPIKLPLSPYRDIFQNPFRTEKYSPSL